METFRDPHYNREYDMVFLSCWLPRTQKVLAVLPLLPATRKGLLDVNGRKA